MRKSLIIILITAIFLSCPPAEETEPEQTEQTDPVSVFVPADFAGMCHAGYSDNLDREFEMLDELGAIWVHWDFSWSSIQPAEDTWNFSTFDARVKRNNAEGKKIIGMLLYQSNWIHDKYDYPRERRIREDQIPYFVNYAVETVKRYNGKPGSEGFVDAWFIWNEPDLQPRFWTGTKEEFFALNKATAKAIRELDVAEGTQTVLVGGVFTALVTDDWITGLFNQGGMLEYKVDGLGFHPYSVTPVGAAGIFNVFKSKVARYGYADKIWVNEMGYPTYSDINFNPVGSGRYGTDQWEGDMPEVVVKTFALLAAAGAKNLTWYHLFDSRSERRDGDSEDWFGLVWRRGAGDWVIKGGYWGFAVAANNIPGKTYKENNFLTGSSLTNIQSCYFEGSDGKHTLVFWNNSPLRTVDVTVTLEGSNFKLWNVETGESVDASATATHTLHPVNTHQKTLVFLTWEE